MPTTLFSLVLFSGWLLLTSQVRAGRLDPHFNPQIGFNDSVFCHAVQADGRILIAGSTFNENTGQVYGLLVRLNADGSADPTFQARVDGRVLSIAVQPDGKIIVGGDFTFLNGVQRPVVARLWPDGLVDSSFAPPFPAAPAVPFATLSILSSGKILLYKDSPLTALNRDGTLDGEFNSRASGLDGRVLTIAEHTHGTILVGGTFTAVQGTLQPGLARLNPDGSLDKTFRPAVGQNEGAEIRQVLVQNDGKVLVFGIFDVVNGVARTHAARLNADGSRDPSFAMSDRFPVAAVVLPDVEKLLVGSWPVDTASSQMIVERINRDGSPDPSLRPFIYPFGPEGLGYLLLTPYQGGVISSGGGTVVVGSNAASQTKVTRLLLEGDEPLPTGLRLGGPIPFQHDLVVMGWSSEGALMVPLYGTERGNKYSIEASEDLQAWRPLEQAGLGPRFPAGNAGDVVILFVDRDAAGYPFTFYRAVRQ